MSRSHRINTAGHIPKEAVSINRAMVRTHTFDLEDFEKIIARPVCPFTNSGLPLLTHPPHQGHTPSKYHRARPLACDAAAIWSMRSFASARCQLCIQSDRPLFRRFPVDAANIRRAAFRADAALQARGVRARTESYGPACGLGHAAERLVSRRLQRHIPR